MTDPEGGRALTWGTWAWIALGMTLAINLGFYVVLYAYDLFHGAAMGKVAGAFNILSAALIFGFCYRLCRTRES